MVLATGWKRLLWVVALLAVIFLGYLAVGLYNEVQFRRESQLREVLVQAISEQELEVLRARAALQDGVYVQPTVVLFERSTAAMGTGQGILFVANTGERDATYSWSILTGDDDGLSAQFLEASRTIAPGDVFATEFILNGPLPIERRTYPIEILRDGVPYGNETIEVLGVSADATSG